MAFTLSQQAEQDLIDIFITGAKQFGIAQAKRYHLQFKNTFEFLAAHPQAAPLRTEIEAPVRIHPTGSHLVIYQQMVDSSIFIIRICHSHEDWLSKGF